MNTISLLNDKFEPARLPDICAPRRKLLEVYSQAAGRRRVYVCTPAGYGKTVTTLLWLHQSKHKAVWIALDEYDNGISVFYNLLARGILSVQPDNQRMSDILKSASFSASPVEYMIQLLLEFHPDDRQFALIFDDMHLIHNEEILKSLPIVLKRLPHSFTLFVLTRNEVSPAIAEQEKEGRISVIGPDNLRFTKAEIQKYFLSMGRSLSPDELNTAQMLTNGWPIGVNAIAKSGLIDEGEGGQVLENYIRKQIWDKWDDSLKKFCMRTSMLNEMPVELVERLTGEAESRQILNQLCAENAFICHLGENKYRYHHLFQDFLRKVTHEQIPHEEVELYKVCARYFKEQHNHLLSLHYWLKSGDYKGIGPYFYSYVFDESNRVMVENIEYFASLFQDFPAEAFREYPALRISRVWFSYVTGDYEGMEKHLDALYKSVPVIALKTPEYMEYVALAYSVDHRENFVSQIKRFGWLGRFIKNFSNGKVTKSIVSFAHNFPYMHRSNRDYSDLLLAGDDILDRLSDTFGKVLGTEWVYARPGLLAGFAYERNRLEEARQHIEECNRLLGPENSKEGIFCTKITIHTITYALGNMTASKAAMAELEELVKQEQYFIPNFNAYKTRYQLWDGNITAAKAWLDQYYVTDETVHLQMYKIYQYLVTARAYLVINETEKAEELLRGLIDFTGHYRRPADQAEARTLLSALLWIKKKKPEAQDAMEQALLQMQPYGYIRVIADEGQAVLPILKKIFTRITKEDYSGGLDSAYVNNVMLTTYQLSKKRKGVTCNLADSKAPVRLSRQQKYVLEFLAQGKTAQQIADLTGLKLPTVKTHLSLAYEKLEVHTAMDAVIKARELQLIDQL